MQRNRVAEKARSAVESAIVTLKAERDAIDAELQTLVAMLGASAPTRKKARVVSGKPRAVALSMIATDPEITAAKLAERTGQPLKQAAATLWHLLKAKRIRRVGRGLYRRVGK